MLNIKTTLNFLPKKVAVSKNFMVFTKSKLWIEIIWVIFMFSVKRNKTNEEKKEFLQNFWITHPTTNAFLARFRLERKKFWLDFWHDWLKFQILKLLDSTVIGLVGLWLEQFPTWSTPSLHTTQAQVTLVKNGFKRCILTRIFQENVFQFHTYVIYYVLLFWNCNNGKVVYKNT